MFKLLECDDDVLRFDQDTFTVGRFKSLIRKDFEANKRAYVIGYLNTSIGTLFQVEDIQWNFQSCQILRIGSNGWQQGKIRFQVTLETNGDIKEFYLEFCPDEPLIPESPLDDLRRLAEYNNV